MEGGFRGEHPRFDAEMDAFEARAIEVSGGVADDHESMAVHARHREVAAFRNRLRAGADHLSAFDQRTNRRMQFVALELVMRIERRIEVVETDDEADVDDAILHPVDEPTAESVDIERPAHGGDDGPRGETIVG